MEDKQGDTGTFRAVSVQRGGFVDETGAPAVAPQKKGPQPTVEVPLQEEPKSGPLRSYFFIGALIFIICALVILLLVMWLDLGLENESTRLGEGTLSMLLVS